MPDTIRAIAFDWGGVFTEGTFDSSAVSNLARAFGVSIQEMSRTYFPLMEAFEAGAYGFEGFYRAYLEKSGLELPFETFERTFLGAVRERRGMFEVLDSIPSEYTVGMLSNNVPVLCDHVRDDPRYGRVEHFVFSNEIGVRKPDAKAFERLSEALARLPEETVFIDDNEANIAACHALGYQGILLDTVANFEARWARLLPELRRP